MAQSSFDNLSRRERQIMDIILRKGFATALEVQTDLVDKPNYSTVRALLRILEDKGYLRHETQGVKYVYHPVVSKKSAEKSAIKNLIRTFYNNSVEKAVEGLLEFDKGKLRDDDLKRLSDIINKAREEDEQDG